MLYEVITHDAAFVGIAQRVRDGVLVFEEGCNKCHNCGYTKCG